MPITHVTVSLGDISVTEPDPFDHSDDPAPMEVGSYTVEAIYRVELNTDGTAVQAREFEYLRLIIERIDADGDMAKTVLDALTVDELAKLRDLLTEIKLPEAVSA